MPIDYGETGPRRIPGSGQQPWRLLGALSTDNGALTAASAKAPRTTKPTTDTESPPGHWVFAPTNEMAVALAMFGTDAANELFDFNVWGWREAWSQSSESKLWIPHLLLSITGATLSARVGLSGAIIANTTFFCDAYTIAADHTPGDSAEIVYNATDGIAALWFDAGGHSIIEVEPKIDTAASCGGMWTTA